MATEDFSVVIIEIIYFDSFREYPSKTGYGSADFNTIYKSIYHCTQTADPNHFGGTARAGKRFSSYFLKNRFLKNKCKLSMCQNCYK